MFFLSIPSCTKTFAHSFTVLPVVYISSIISIFLFSIFDVFIIWYAPLAFSFLCFLFNVLCGFVFTTFFIILFSIFIDSCLAISVDKSKLWLYPLSFFLCLLIGTITIISYFFNFSKLFRLFSKKYDIVL